MTEITHGTLEAFNAGCTSKLNCPNHWASEPTCKQIDLRYRSDYQFRKQIDAGMTPAQILEAERVAEEEAKQALAAAKAAARLRPPKPPKEPKPRRIRETKGIIGPDGLIHGTMHGYKRCKGECPATDHGLQSCGDLGRAWARENWASKYKTKPKRVAKHGTESGYTGFKCRSGCPGGVDGVPCSQAASAKASARHQAKKAKAAA